MCRRRRVSPLTLPTWVAFTAAKLASLAMRKAAALFGGSAELAVTKTGSLEESVPGQRQWYVDS